MRQSCGRGRSYASERCHDEKDLEVKKETVGVGESQGLNVDGKEERRKN